mgnify:CR=1 FL=1
MKKTQFTCNDSDDGYDQDWLDELAGEKNSEWEEF